MFPLLPKILKNRRWVGTTAGGNGEWEARPKPRRLILTAAKGKVVEEGLGRRCR
jgi:hypothetical protein